MTRMTGMNRPIGNIILKFPLGSEAWGNKTKEIILRPSNEQYISFVLFPQASEPSMNFNIANMVQWMATITVRNGITGMTRMTQMTGMTRMTSMNWMARMTVMNGITVVTRMTEIKSTKLSTIMQMQSAFVSLKQFVKQDSSLLV